MAFQPVGFVNGGQVNGELLRRSLWVSSAGAEGVTDAVSLKVTALASPGAAVNVAAGGVVFKTRFVNASQQSYFAANNATIQVPIEARTTETVWYIIVRAIDAQYAGNTADPNGINVVCEAVTAYPTTKAFYPLAKVTVPANTTSITNAMIEDLRDLANPRSRTEQKLILPNKSQTMALQGWTSFPTQGFGIQVPQWATYLEATCTIANVRYRDGGSTATTYANIAIARDGEERPNYSVIEADNNGYVPAITASRFDVRFFAGGWIYLSLQAYQTQGPGTFSLTPNAAVIWTTRFLERTI